MNLDQKKGQISLWDKILETLLFHFCFFIVIILIISFTEHYGINTFFINVLCFGYSIYAYIFIFIAIIIPLWKNEDTLGCLKK